MTPASHYTYPWFNIWVPMWVNELLVTAMVEMAAAPYPSRVQKR